MVRSPEGRSATLERGGGAVCCRGSQRGGLERGGDRSAGSGVASDGPYCGAGCEPREDWAFSGFGKDFGRCRRVGAVEQSFFPFGLEEDGRSRLAVVVEPGKVVGTVGLIAFCVLKAIWSLG